MGRPKKFSRTELQEKWEAYKDWCDNQTVLCHDFSAKNSEFVSAELKKPITYTIEGFCVWVGLARSAFYASYRDNKRYSDIVTRMREECEVDARRKFETGQIPTQLAGLWMSKHGYSTKVAAELNSDDAKIQEFLEAVTPDVKTVEGFFREED